jgi:hypothetical protein
MNIAIIMMICSTVVSVAEVCFKREVVLAAWLWIATAFLVFKQYNLI